MIFSDKQYEELELVEESERFPMANAC